MYHVRILEPAIRELARIDPTVRRRIAARLRWLAEHIGHIRLEPLSGHLTGFYKLRVSDYRVIYEILHDEQVIIVHAVGHRREIYRKR